MYQRILVPIDGSPTSSKGLDEAIGLGKLTGATLRLIHVVDAMMFATGFEPFAAYGGDLIPIMREAGTKVLQEGEARVRAGGVQVQTHLFEPLVGRVAEVVAKDAADWKADLIVIGTHGRRGVGRVLMGSDAEQIARIASAPVLLVRSADAPAAAA